jgi:hypothetical protein
MDDDDELLEQPDDADDGDEEDSDDASALQSALEAFRQQQRILASFDFSAVTAAQRAIANSGIFDAITAIQESVNFSALQDVAKSIAASVPSVQVIDPKWIDQLTKSIDVSAIARANALILSNASFIAASQRQADAMAAIAAKFDYSALTKQLSSVLEGIDWAELQKVVERWLPSNLRSARDLAAVAQLSLDEGLPLVWVPRAEIVEKLTSAATPEDRLRILSDHFDDILDDCEAALVDISHDWANQCRSALRALRQPGLEGPAQSHAGNIIDSIVLAILGGGGRGIAKQRAEEPFEDLPLQVAVESLVLRPLFLGFVNWYPDTGDPIPPHFARHPTAHAVGQVGVFTRQKALIAVMLATSLTAQFWNDPDAPAAPTI